MYCRDCPKYSTGLRRCINGKANPATKKATREVISLMGSDYICSLNKWKKEVISSLIQARQNNG